MSRKSGQRKKGAAKSTNIQDLEDEDQPKQKKMTGSSYLLLILGLVGTLVVVGGGVWFVVEDPWNIFPGGSDIPAGGFVVLNTYSIASRYFF